MRRNYLIISAVIFGILIIAAEWFYPLVGVLADAIGMLGLVMLVLSLAFGLLNLIFERVWTRDCKQASVAGLMMLGWALIVLFCCSVSDTIAFHLAKGYPQQVDATLEQFHQQYGRYPESLAEIPTLPRCPAHESFFGSEKEYVFFYPQGGFASGYSYSSTNKTWVWTSD